MSNPLKRGREESQPDVDEGPSKKQKISENNILDYLHDELVQHILVFVPHEHVGSLRLVCKLFNNIIQSQEYWRRKSIEEWDADDVIPEPRALSLSASSDALLSNTEYLIPFIKDGSKILIHWRQYYITRKKLHSFIDELMPNFTEEDSVDFDDVSELKIADIKNVLGYIETYNWDDDDPILWPEGNKFQNNFSRLMFDCTAEILLVYINNEKWEDVEHITRNIFPKMDLAGSFINHEAICVKLLQISEALQDKATYVVPYFHKAVSCFKILKEVTPFTKRVYRRVVDQQIKMGLLTHYLPLHPTKHLHFRYPQKSFQAIVLTKLYPLIEELVPILFATVAKVFYDPKSDWRSRASALAALRTVSIPADDKLAYGLFEFALDAIKIDNEEVLHAGLVLLYETATFCGDIHERISDEQAICLFQIVTQQIRKQPVQHGLFLVEILGELLEHQKSPCLSDQLLDELNKNVLWLLQQQGVINNGSVEFHALNKIQDLGKIFRSRMRPYLPAYKEVLFNMALSADLKANLTTNEEILAVYYGLLKDTVEDFDREGKVLIDQVLQNAIGFEVRHPQFFALCGNIVQQHHFRTEENRDQLALIIKAMLALFTDQIHLYGQSLYPDAMLPVEIPSDIPDTLDQFLNVTKDIIIDKKVTADKTDLAEFFNFEATPEPQDVKETNSPYIVKVNFLDVYENDFDRVAIRQELSSHFGIAAIENLMEIALRMKQDFLPFAQTTLHVALALFRVGVPPKHYLTFGIGELLQLIKDELGDYDKMQYVKILTQRLDFFFTHYFDTLRAQKLVSSLNHLYMICAHYQLKNPYITPTVIKCMLDFFLEAEQSPHDPQWPKVLPEIIRIYVLGHPRKTYTALLKSKLKESGWFLTTIEANDHRRSAVFEALSFLVIYFGIDYSLSLFNSPLPTLELLKKVRDSCLQFYMETKATLSLGTRVFLEVFIVLSSAALFKQEILEFRFFQTFIFNMEMITDALEKITSDEEVKQQYGTGNDEFDKFIVEDILEAHHGFTAWYWVGVLKHYGRVLALENSEDKPPE